MNDYITYCAQAKLLRLLEKDGATSARIIANPKGGISFEFLFTAPSSSDIMVSSTPRVFTDLFTLKKLTHASVDFSYTSEEFIIKRGYSYDDSSHNYQC